LIRAAEAVEVVHVHGAEIDLQCLEQITELHALLLHPVAIHIGEELRHIDLIARVHARELPGLIGACRERLGGVVERLLSQASTVLELELESTHGAKSVYRRRWEHRDE